MPNGRETTGVSSMYPYVNIMGVSAVAAAAATATIGLAPALRTKR